MTRGRNISKAALAIPWGPQHEAKIASEVLPSRKQGFHEFLARVSDIHRQICECIHQENSVSHPELLAISEQLQRSYRFNGQGETPPSAIVQQIEYLQEQWKQVLADLLHIQEALGRNQRSLQRALDRKKHLENELLQMEKSRTPEKNGEQSDKEIAREKGESIALQRRAAFALRALNDTTKHIAELDSVDPTVISVQGIPHVEKSLRNIQDILQLSVMQKLEQIDPEKASLQEPSIKFAHIVTEQGLQRDVVEICEEVPWKKALEHALDTIAGLYEGHVRNILRSRQRAEKDPAKEFIPRDEFWINFHTMPLNISQRLEIFGAFFREIAGNDVRPLLEFLLKMEVKNKDESMASRMSHEESRLAFHKGRKMVNDLYTKSAPKPSRNLRHLRNTHHHAQNAVFQFARAEGKLEGIRIIRRTIYTLHPLQSTLFALGKIIRKRSSGN